MRRRRVLEATPAALATLAGCFEGSTATEPPDTDSSADDEETPTAPTEQGETETPTQDRVSLPWTQLPGPPGGPVSGVAVSPADPDHLYAICLTGGPYASTDGGESWLQSPERMHHGVRMVASPHDPAEARNGKGYRTADAGRIWYDGSNSHEKLREPRTEAGVADLVFDPFEAGVLYAGTTAGFYRTFDGGLNWERVALEVAADDSRINRVTAHREREGVVAAVLPDLRIAVSNDRGDSWRVVEGTEAIPSKPYSDGLVLDHTTENAGYVQSGTAVYRFGDGGVREVTADVGPLRLLFYADLHLSADARRLYFVAKPTGTAWTNSRLYVHDADAGTVRPLDHPGYAASAATHPDDPATVYLGGARWVYESTDAGVSWTALSDDFYDRYLAAAGVNPDRGGTVVPGSICSSGIWASHDGGRTYDWKRAGLEPFLEHAGARHYEEHYVMRVAGAGDRMYATTAAGLLVSTDNGATWRLSTDVPGYDTHGLDHYHGLGVDPSDPRRVFVGTGLGRHAETNTERGQTPTVDRTSRIWRSTDGADTWTEVTDGFPSGKRTVVQDLLVRGDDPSVVLAGTNADDYIAVGRGRRGGTGLGVFRSRDAGDHWHSLHAPFENVHALAQDAASPERLYATAHRGVFRSDDGGDSWKRVFRPTAKALAAHPKVGGLVFAGARKHEGYWDAFVSADGGETWRQADLTVRIGRSTSDREYDGIDYNADQTAGGGGDLMQFSIDPGPNHLIAATRGAGLWRCELDSLL